MLPAILAAGEAKPEKIWPKSIPPGAFTAKDVAVAVRDLAGGRVRLAWIGQRTTTLQEEGDGALPRYVDLAR